MQKKKFIEMIETLEQHQPAIIGLNYDYNRNQDTGRTSVTLNGLMVAIVSRTDTPDLFKVNMVNIAHIQSKSSGETRRNAGLIGRLHAFYSVAIKKFLCENQRVMRKVKKNMQLSVFRIRLPLYFAFINFNTLENDSDNQNQIKL